MYGIVTQVILNVTFNFNIKGKDGPAGPTGSAGVKGDKVRISVPF